MQERGTGEGGGAVTVQYGSDDFNRMVEDVGAAVNDGGKACIVYAGGGSEARQSALTALADYTSLDVFERHAAALVGDRPEQTRGNLREAFDSAGDVRTLLVFVNADAVFDASERQRIEDDLDEDALTPLEFMFSRIHHRPGITILHLADPKHVERARREGVDVIVQF